MGSILFVLFWGAAVIWAGAGKCVTVKALASESVQGTEPSENGQSSGFTGWKTGKKGKTYYYINNVRQKGFTCVDNRFYYFEEKNGALYKGWKLVDGKFRYFYKKTGVMVTNKTVNGRVIDEKGIWTPVIVVDPGHSGVVKGGYEPVGPGARQQKAKDNSGTQGVATGVEEYQLNLDVSRLLKKELQKRGCKVILTRKNNKKSISCKERAMVANKNNADVFIRIHANGSSSPYAKGAMTISTTKYSPYVSKKMSRKNKALSEKVLNEYVKATGISKEYVWETDEMTGNNWSRVPTTLIELGYMSNPSEDRKMQKKSCQKKMVKGIANGIERFLTER